ncbi:ABC transporter permease [Streptantibioticus cattleyicolor]|uniref:Binding-protein-dependent transport systems inner membrane component n=1 Tax=Streptantibioticus cattleyicolor (strain ATCC 35852 / DSM 46488 / JCM 4925 / NBRC 14057 / NRRL 8057) TaxID=1003195 RepID=F8JJ39_STREN|nr:ABC transporter permease [Streptantibioticus cattleyicolor]AEW98868.1 binding-protein-dependent transport systems inner membrane component [Streptantibioticus cattleyicolor NRRL 8057 = DSM 46488]CCB72085.1 Polyamine ABC-transporter integral membrane protein [Streptantibioticus cattleyicolor NRRL 8057 = DSM 46488]
MTTYPVRRRRAPGLRVYTWLVLAWLLLPIAVMILFGFNHTRGKVNFTWQGFTLTWYRHLFAIPDLTGALVNSVTIALITAVVATALGTPLGYALGRHRFRGRGSVDFLLFAAIAAPEIALGAALLSLFITLGVPRGYWTVVVAHVAFCVPYVSITVRARMAGHDPSLEEAARDLGAGPWTAFRLVTLPALLPGVVSGALLCFALSIDDYVVTSFNAGRTVTFPLWVYSAGRTGVPPQVNVMGTLIFLGGLLVAGVNVLLSRRRPV